MDTHTQNINPWGRFSKSTNEWEFGAFADLPTGSCHCLEQKWIKTAKQQCPISANKHLFLKTSVKFCQLLLSSTVFNSILIPLLIESPAGIACVWLFTLKSVLSHSLNHMDTWVASKLHSMSIYLDLSTTERCTHWRVSRAMVGWVQLLGRICEGGKQQKISVSQEGD